MGFAQKLLDEIQYNENIEKKQKEFLISDEVEEEIYIAIQQELDGNLSSTSAQALIDEA